MIIYKLLKSVMVHMEVRVRGGIHVTHGTLAGCTDNRKKESELDFAIASLREVGGDRRKREHSCKGERGREGGRGEREKEGGGRDEGKRKRER